MRFFNLRRWGGSDLFKYLPAEEVHPHDHFLNRWFLRFLPDRITPNQISMLRIILTPLVLSVIIFGNYKAGIILFLLTSFTDALDGSLARTKNRVTRFGMLLDPLADKLLIGGLVIIIVFRHFHFLLGFTILVLEIIFIVTALVTQIRFKTVRMANIWGKIKMILQVLAVFLTLMALLLDFPLLMTAAAWVFGLAIGFALLSLFKHGV